MSIVEQISLAYKDGGSDKVYHAQIEKVDGGYNVNFQYGKRGATLATGCKTPSPVDLEKANVVFTKLIKEKTAKGYSEGESGAIFQSKSLEDRFTGIIPQLLNKITNPQDYIDNDEYFMQEKYDGQRRLIKIENGVVTSINKKGLEVLSPQEVIDPILALKCDIIVDGELIGDKYYIFDILYLNDKDLKAEDAQNRYAILKSTGLPGIVPAYFTKKDKQEAYDFLILKENKKEGVVFKKNKSAYVGGRPNSGGNQLKNKFYATDTFEVISHNETKRSVNVVSYTESGDIYDMGKITIPETTPLPDVGMFVEIRYLYCHVGGKLFQTTYLGVREDQDRTDCHMREIKFKSQVDEDDE